MVIHVLIYFIMYSLIDGPCHVECVHVYVFAGKRSDEIQTDIHAGRAATHRSGGGE